MAEPVIRIFPDPETLFQNAAETITNGIATALERKPIATFVLAGGKTPRAVYELLGSLPFRGRLDWPRIHFLWGDERCVPPGNRESNFEMVRESLFSRVPVPALNIHRMFGELEETEKAAHLYEEEIGKFAEGAAVPSFDMVLLGLGADGHTASLFPGTRWDEDRLVVVNSAPSAPHRRLTMTPWLLNAAREVVFLVSGRSKARALAGVLEDPEADYPAKRIDPVSGSRIWLADSDAASLLARRP